MESESWLKLATRVDVVRRATKVALVVGTLLVAINHGDAILAGTASLDQVLKMMLTMLVPYGVSTYSSVGALRAPRG